MVKSSEAAITAAESAEDQTKNTLFVRGIPFTATNEELETFFSEFGPLRSCFAVIDKEAAAVKKNVTNSASADSSNDAPKNRGFGFVQFALHADALRAVADVGKTKFQGKKLKAEIALKKKISTERKSPFEMPNPNQHLKKKEVAAQRNIQYTRPRVIVRNLSFKCTSEDLSTCFSAHGKVKNITIPTKPTGEMRGFAFIEFDSMQEAKKAVEKVNGTKIVGRIVAVDLSLPKDRYDSLTVKEDEVVVKEEESATDDVVMGDESVKEVKDAEDEEEDVSEGEVEEGVEGDDTMEVDDSQVEPASFQKRGPSLKGDPEATLFIRNLSFESQEEELLEMFSAIAPVRYARITKDRETGRSRGTGFVCFMEIEDADECLKEYSKAMQATSANMEPVIPNKKFVSSSSASVLIPEPSTTASSFDFTLGGRFLNITSAVSRQEANKLTNESEKRRQKEDKRNLYLMKEGVIMQDSEAAKDLTPSELSKRHASYVQRKKMITENPNLFISKTRLSVRNLGRNITDHMLRVVGRLGVDRYWKQIEAGLRSDVLEPEVVEEELKEKRKTPSLGRKVVVKQAKIVLDKERVDPKTNTGRSKGYGFIEFQSHADALACLRWMNNNPTAMSITEYYCSLPPATSKKAALAAPPEATAPVFDKKKGAAAEDNKDEGKKDVDDQKKKKPVVGMGDFNGFGPKTTLEQLEAQETASGKVSESKFRPIVEFAIENRVVLRNRGMKKQPPKPQGSKDASSNGVSSSSGSAGGGKKDEGSSGSKKRKDRGGDVESGGGRGNKKQKLDKKVDKKQKKKDMMEGKRSWNGKTIKPEKKGGKGEGGGGGGAAAKKNVSKSSLHKSYT